MRCEKHGVELKQLFTSAYCERCDAEAADGREMVHDGNTYSWPVGTRMETSLPARDCVPVTSVDYASGAITCEAGELNDGGGHTFVGPMISLANPADAEFYSVVKYDDELVRREIARSFGYDANGSPIGHYSQLSVAEKVDVLHQWLELGLMGTEDAVRLVGAMGAPKLQEDVAWDGNGDVLRVGDRVLVNDSYASGARGVITGFHGHNGVRCATVDVNSGAYFLGVAASNLLLSAL